MDELIFKTEVLEKLNMIKNEKVSRNGELPKIDRAIECIKELPTISTTTTETEIKSEESEPYFNNDLISRKAVLDMMNNIFFSNDFAEFRIEYGSQGAMYYAVNYVKELPTIPQTYEWCKGCKEYDTENHCCHRYSSFIRESLQDNINAVLEDIKAEIHEELYGDISYTDLERIEHIIDKHIRGKE